MLVAPVAAFSPLAAQDIGFEGPSFSGAGSTPTEAKPESKLWFNDGIWWGSLWSTSASAFRIHRLNFTTHAWTDTGVAIESRPNSHSDVLWDGTKLYIASHQFVANGGSSGNPILVFRYSYNTSTDTYSLDVGFPVTIGDFSTEALVIDKDSTGTVWAAWTQALRVRIAHTLASDTSWSASVVLPTNTTNINVDDICGLVRFGNKIGVLWSDQVVNAYRFSTHVDGTADTVWTAVENATTGETDDHMNLSAHSDGRVFFVGKNAANNLLLLVRATTGTWSRFIVSPPTPVLTRPIVLLNEPGNLIHVFTTGQDTGEVFEKTSPIDSISFAAGTGTIRLRDSSTVFRISNPTSTKQNIDAASGLVVLAHHDTTGFYWHHDVAPSGTAPVANFSASPTTGQAPLNVTFTDASTGSITSRSWAFGDGGTSTATSPSHSYAAVGSYTVTLTVTGPGGSDSETKTNFITVLPPPPVANFSASPTTGQAPLNVTFTDASTGSITSRSWAFGDGGTSTATSPSHSYSAAGSYTVTLTVTGPGGSDSEVKTNFIVVSAPPAPVANFSASPTTGQAPLNVTFTDASTGSITSRSWAFGDGGTSTATSPSHSYTAVGTYTVTLTVTGPGGSDSETKIDLIVVSPPPPPVADFGASPTSGEAPLNVNFTDASTGSITSRSWSFGDGGTSTATSPSHTYSAAGLYTVSLTVTGPGGSDTETKTDLLAVSPTPPPLAGFSAAPTSGEAPLDVAFTDTSTGSVTSWVWDFGDGATSTVQSPMHTYLMEGTFTVSLTVTGPGGTDGVTMLDLIEVTPPPPIQTLLPVADARVNEASPSANAGTATEIRVRFAAGGSYHSYLRFDLSGVIEPVVSAKLRLFCTDDGPVGGLVFPTSNGWSETAITWANKPAATGGQIGSLGAAALNAWVEVDLTGAVSGGGLVSFLLTSTSSNSVLYSSREGANPPELVVETGFPEPPVAEFSALPLAGSVPLDVSFSDASTGSVTAHSWDFGDGGTSTATNPSHTYSAVGTYTVSLTVTGPGGSDTETKIDLIVVSPPPAPVADFGASPTSGGEPLEVGFTDASTGVITSRSWSFGDGGTSTATNPSHTYVAFGTYTVSLTVTGPGGSDTETKTDFIVVLPPPPVADFGASPTSGVEPLIVDFTDASTGVVTSRSWSFGDGGTSTATNPSHTYVAAGTYTVSLTVTGPGGSDTETKIGLIVVLPPPPVADFSADPTSGVEPLIVAFTDASTGVITSRSWDFGDGSTSTATNPSHTYVAAGTYTVSLTATGPGGSDTETKIDLIVVSPPPAPVADFGASPTSGVEPLIVGFTDASTGVISSRSWSFGDGGTSTATNPSHTYVAAGTYTVSLTVTGPGGSDTETKTDFIVVLPPPPVADFGASPTSGQVPLEVTFSDESTGVITSRSWSFGDGGTSTSASPSHTYSAVGTYTVSLTVTGPGGADTETKTNLIVVLPPPPVADFSADPTSGQVPLAVDFTDASTGVITSRSWSFGDGGTSTATNPSHTYVAVGTYTVSLTVTGPGGSDTETKIDLIVVSPPPPPVADFGASPTSGVEPLIVAFTDASTGAITSRSWDFGDGGTSTATNPSHTYSAAGTYTVSLTATGPGGSDTETKIDLIVVSPPPAPVADFGASPTSGGEPLEVGFTDASTGVISSRSWSFGDGGTSTATNPSHTYVAFGTYTVSLTVTGPGGSDTETKTDFIVVLPPPPVADFGASPTSGQVPLEVTFSDESTGVITSRSWSFGDGGTSTSASPSHTYSAVGTYTVSLTVTGPGGADTETKTNLIVVLPPPPVADFSADPTSGQVPLAVDFTDASTGVITSRSWSFGDGGTSTATNPSHTYVAVGTYTVSLTVTGPGGSDTETKIDLIVVSPPPPPVADFGASPTSGVEPLIVAFTDASTGAITSRSWDFGDGGTSTATNPSHTYSAAGTYTVSLTATGPGGSDTETKIDLIVVSPPPAPVADFGASPTSGVEPLIVAFTDASTGAITSRSWDFGDGGTSTATNPSHTYSAAGTYTVSLTATGPGGSDTETKIDLIVVSPPPPPVADFNASPTNGAAPLNVAFTDTSTGSITAWQWDFGDGATSTVQHPMHAFAVGTFTVSLTVTGPGGMDGVTKLDLIQVSAPPANQTLLPVADSRVSESNQGSNYGISSDLRVRSAAGGSVNTYLRFDLTGVAAVVSAKLRLFCTDGSPVGGLVFPTSSGWSEMGVNWTNKPAATGGQVASLGTVVTGTWVEFDVTAAASGGGLRNFLLTSTSSNSALYSSREGAHSPELVIETGTPIAPAAEFSASPLTGSAPLAVAFTDQSAGGITSWSWTFGDGASSSEQNPMHVYAAAGTFTVTLEVSNAAGSSSITKTDLVSVGPPPPIQTLLPVADARVYESSPSSNFGSADELRVRSSAGASYRTYLRFDLTGSGPVVSAKLRLFCTDGSPVGGLAFLTSNGWSETDVTWTNKPAATSGQLASVGTVVTDTWVEFDVSAAVAGGGPVSFVLTSTSSNSAVYSSREGDDPPELVVETGMAVVPQAEFSANPLTGSAPLSVAFTDQSTGGPTSWSWTFGDGASSSAQNPMHTYLTPGTFTVTLDVSNAEGSSSITKTDLVSVGPPSPIQTYLPVADSRVNEGSPSSNAGTATELRVRSEAGGSYHTYVRFDLAGLTGTVTSAKLRLFCTDGSPVGGLVFKTTSGWSETGITWANKPAATGGQVASLGTVVTDAWVEVDLTSAVAAPGLLSFVLTSTSSNSAFYSSREGSRPPELIVTTAGP